MSITLTDALKLISICVASYIAIVCILRISGKRTLSKMSAFDFIVTVALGSVLATTIVSYKDSFWNGMLAFATLVALQYLSTWLSVRSSAIHSALQAEPTLLFYKGNFQNGQLKQARVTKGELKQAIRESGYGSFEQVAAIVLEANGTLSVIGPSDAVSLEKEKLLTDKEPPTKF